MFLWREGALRSFCFGGGGGCLKQKRKILIYSLCLDKVNEQTLKLNKLSDVKGALCSSGEEIQNSEF